MATDNTQNRIDQINQPAHTGIDIEPVGNRDAVENRDVIADRDMVENRDVIADPVDRPRYGLDDDPNNDAEKGAALGGLGGAAVGAAAGSVAGPIGTLIGAVAGGLVGAGASGAAVAAVDAIDNDNTVTGVGSGVTLDSTGERVDVADVPAATVIDAHPVSGDPIVPGGHGHNIVTGGEATTEKGDDGLLGGAVVGGVVGAAVGGPVGAAVGGTLGSLAGGVAGDAAEAADQETLRPTDTISTEGYVPETQVLSNPGINNPGAPLAGTSIGTPMTGVDPAFGDETVSGHNIVTGGPATTEAGDDGLVGGALVGGVVGAAVGGPVGAVVGGTVGSLAGGVAGDAAEAAADDETNIRVNSRDV